MKRPLAVTLISFFYIYQAFVFFTTSIFFHENAEWSIADSIGLPNFPEQSLRIILAIFSVVIAFGYIRLKRWGFWLLLLFSIGNVLISFVLIISNNQPPLIGTFIFYGITIIYTLYVRKCFLK